MADLNDLAATLFGGRRAETNSVLTDGTTHTYVGTATSDSQDGHVMVELSSDVTNPEPIEIDGETYYSDADTSVELPTTTSVQEGDEVLVSVYGGTPLRSPVVTGVVGSGDRVAGMAQDAYDLADSVEGIAQQALDVANATGQHFWSGTDGAHVTEVTQEEWTDPTDPGYQSGPNSLWNSLGMLFRNGLTDLLGIIMSPRKTFSVTTTAAGGTHAIYLDGKAQSVTSVSVDGVELSTSDYTVRTSATSGNTIIGLRQSVAAGSTVDVAYIGTPAVSIFDGDNTNPVAEFSRNMLNLMSGTLRLWAGGEWASGNSGLITADNGLIIGAGESNTAETPWANIPYSIELLPDYIDESLGQEIRGGLTIRALSNDESHGELQINTNSIWLGNSFVGESVTIEQAIISLTRPMATWTGTNGTVTDGAGWHQTDFNTMLAQHGPWSDYFTLSGGRITALRDVTLQLTMDLSWNDNVLGIRGAGFFKNSAVGSGVNEISSFSAKSANNRFYCVFPSRLITLNAGEYLNIGRYNQLANSIFTRGTNYTWLTVEVVG